VLLLRLLDTSQIMGLHPEVLTEIQFFAALMAAYYGKWEKRAYAVPFIEHHQTTSQVVSDTID